VVPLLLYPMMIIGMTRFQESLEQESRTRTAKLAVWGDAPAALLNELREHKFELLPGKGLTDEIRQKLARNEYEPFETYPIDDESPEARAKRDAMRDRAAAHPLTVAARPLILDRQVDLVLVIWPPGIADGAQQTAILYDSVRQDSSQARTRLEASVAAYRKSVLVKREGDHGLPAGF